jgi:Recombinase
MARKRTHCSFCGKGPDDVRIMADAHPNPAKAADGKRLHRLEVDPAAAPVVRRIFEHYLAGHGYHAIASDLTQDGIPSPSAMTLSATATATSGPGRRSRSGRFP